MRLPSFKEDSLHAERKCLATRSVDSQVKAPSLCPGRTNLADLQRQWG